MLRAILVTIQIALLSALIIATRCANYQDVFVAGKIYFIDADCYARMTRVQLLASKPGRVLRHHDFENFPEGTTPHTTAPLDYLIFGLSLLLNPFTAHALDLAGAFISPLVALLGGWFLWWWSGRMKLRYRWLTLILYAISPILVHATELGRPDHQSLLILLVIIAICAEWRLQTLEAGGMSSDATSDSRMPPLLRVWSLTAAVPWAVAIWVSAYEPLILFVLVIGAATATRRRTGWLLFVAIIAIAFAIEQRLPSFAIFPSKATLRNWAGTIGELAHVSPTNPVWFSWCGYLLLLTPFFIWINLSRKRYAHGLPALPVYLLLIATYFLTIWQARWAYFFASIFALALPALLAPIQSASAVWIAFALSIFPILREWDHRLWPNEAQLATRVEKRIELVQIRDFALSLRSSDTHPFLAPWWLSPAIAYWSGQPGVAGSSHEGIEGIEDSARFFLSNDLQTAREILNKHHVAWVFVYDAERVAQNSAAILNKAVPQNVLCRVLDRTPSQAPPFLALYAQISAGKLYRVVNQ